MSLHGLAIGEKLLVFREDKLVAVEEVRSSEKRQVRTKYGRYSLSTSKELGGTRRIERATPEQVTEAEAQLERELEERIKADDAKRKAKYDALPEEVKLARKLSWFCNCNSENTIAKIPLHLLREIVAWVEANKLECE